MARSGRWIGLGIAAIIAAVAAYRLAGTSGTAKPTAPAPVLVEVATAQRGSVAVTLDALGTVAAYRTVTVQPMITGPLARVLFHEGQFVARGAPLAEIDPAPYRAALAQAEAKLAQDQASLVNAQLQARQYASLVQQNYTSKQQAANAQAAALEAQALVKQDEAAIETDRINLGYTRITAPISGRTGILQVNAGNIVSPGLAGGIVTINTLQPISVQFSLPQQDLPQILAATRAGPVRLFAISGSGASAVRDEGTLSVLDNAVNSNTGTLTLKGKFPNPRLDLWPGAFVDVQVLVRSIAGAVTVPPVAVQQGPQGSFVYLVQPAPAGKTGRIVQVRAVTPGYDDGSAVVIRKGLAAGDVVVTEGTSHLRDGAQVEIVATPAAPVAASPAAKAPAG